MPVQGLVRLRKHQFGRQDAQGAVSAATRAYPHQGTPDRELNWTDPEIDAGSIDPVAPPTREAPTLSADLESPVLYYNNLTKILCGFFGGMVLPTTVATTGRQWVHEPESESIDEPDYFTYEFGDDVLTDWDQLPDGIIESFEITGPVGLGAMSATETWRFGAYRSTGSTDSPVTNTVPTPGLSVDIASVPMYLKDMAIYIASSTAGLGAGQVTDALYNFTLRAEHEIDEKRWANGDQSFDVDELVPGARSIEFEGRFAKTSDIVGVGSEADAWMSDVAVNRWIRLAWTSKEFVGGSTPYSFTVTMPARYYTREEDEEGGNTVVVLTAHAFFDPNDLGHVWESTLVNTLTADQLGEGGS